MAKAAKAEAAAAAAAAAHLLNAAADKKLASAFQAERRGAGGSGGAMLSHSPFRDSDGPANAAATPRDAAAAARQEAGKRLGPAFLTTEIIRPPKMEVDYMVDSLSGPPAGSAWLLREKGRGLDKDLEREREGDLKLQRERDTAEKAPKGKDAVTQRAAAAAAVAAAGAVMLDKGDYDKDRLLERDHVTEGNGGAGGIVSKSAMQRPSKLPRAKGERAAAAAERERAALERAGATAAAAPSQGSPYSAAAALPHPGQMLGGGG
eukprot:SM002676S09863  [mRNA]  locus=s2676:3:1668:- [translate_table: standard]